jgi:two-component system chemotaxis response regulator CheY
MRTRPKLLQDLGFVDVCEADHGATALPMLRHKHYDLLITHWSMRRMKGLGVLRATGYVFSMANLPVLLVTAQAKREQIVEAAALGIAGYVVKP